MELVTNIQTLETTGKPKEVNDYTRTTLDKLPRIKVDLARTDDNWFYNTESG